MERTLSATEARVHFGEVLDGVAQRGDIVFVERMGNLQAVIVSPEMWKHSHQHEEDKWDKAERLMRESHEYFLQRYGPDHFANFDVDAEIDAGWEERAREIDGLLR